MTATDKFNNSPTSDLLIDEAVNKTDKPLQQVILPYTLLENVLYKLKITETDVSPYSFEKALILITKDNQDDLQTEISNAAIENKIVVILDNITYNDIIYISDNCKLYCFGELTSKGLHIDGSYIDIYINKLTVDCGESETLHRGAITFARNSDTYDVAEHINLTIDILESNDNFDSILLIKSDKQRGFSNITINGKVWDCKNTNNGFNFKQAGTTNLEDSNLEGSKTSSISNESDDSFNLFYKDKETKDFTEIISPTASPVANSLIVDNRQFIGKYYNNNKELCFADKNKIYRIKRLAAKGVDKIYYIYIQGQGWRTFSRDSHNAYYPNYYTDMENKKIYDYGCYMATILGGCNFIKNVTINDIKLYTDTNENDSNRGIKINGNTQYLLKNKFANITNLSDSNNNKYYIYAKVEGKKQIKYYSPKAEMAEADVKSIDIYHDIENILIKNVDFNNCANMGYFKNTKNIHLQDCHYKSFNAVEDWNSKSNINKYFNTDPTVTINGEESRNTDYGFFKERKSLIWCEENNFDFLVTGTEPMVLEEIYLYENILTPITISELEDRKKIMGNIEIKVPILHRYVDNNGYITDEAGKYKENLNEFKLQKTSDGVGYEYLYAKNDLNTLYHYLINPITMRWGFQAYYLDRQFNFSVVGSGYSIQVTRAASNIYDYFPKGENQKENETKLIGTAHAQNPLNVTAADDSDYEKHYIIGPKSAYIYRVENANTGLLMTHVFNLTNHYVHNPYLCENINISYNGSGYQNTINFPMETGSASFRARCNIFLGKYYNKKTFGTSSMIFSSSILGLNRLNIYNALGDLQKQVGGYFFSTRALVENEPTKQPYRDSNITLDDQGKVINRGAVVGMHMISYNFDNNIFPHFVQIKTWY